MSCTEYVSKFKQETFDRRWEKKEMFKVHTEYMPMYSL